MERGLDTGGESSLPRDALDGQAYLARAQAAFAEGRWQECLEAAEAAVEREPTNILARELRHSAAAEIEQAEQRRLADELAEEKRRRRRAVIDHYLGAARAGLSGAPARLAGLAELAERGAGALKSIPDLLPSTPPSQGAAAPAERAATRAAATPAGAGQAREPAVYDLPSDWDLSERLDEAAPRDTADFSDALRFSGGEADVALARHYIATNPADDQAYCWLARHHLLRGQFAAGRQVLADGLANCARRRRLCQAHAWLELEAGRPNEAAVWWLRSAFLQLAARRLDTREPFLYLSHLAAVYGLPERADHLMAVVDGIQPLRLSEGGKEELRALAAQADKKTIVAGIEALGKRLEVAGLRPATTK